MKIDCRKANAENKEENVKFNLIVESERDHTLSDMLQYMKEDDIPLAGAVYDYSCPQTGKIQRR